MEDYRAQVRRMWQILNVVDGVYWRWSKKQGLTANQLVFLYAVDDGAAHTQKELCEEWLIPKTTLNTIVKEYEQAGYIVLENAEGRLKKNLFDESRQRIFCQNAKRCLRCRG